MFYKIIFLLLIKLSLIYILNNKYNINYTTKYMLIYILKHVNLYAIKYTYCDKSVIYYVLNQENEFVNEISKYNKIY